MKRFMDSRSISLSGCAIALAIGLHCFDASAQSATTATASPGSFIPQASSAAVTAASSVHNRAAEDAYLAGARKLDHNDLDGAEREFARAVALDPGNGDYSVALTVAREHKVSALVQQARQARLKGDTDRASKLLAQAKAIDPTNPILLEHMDPIGGAKTAESTQPANGLTAPAAKAIVVPADSPLAGSNGLPIALTGTIQLDTSSAVKSFHLRGDARDILLQVAAGFGIRAVFDPSVERKNIRFDIEDADYQHAMNVLLDMAHTFAVPLDERSVLIARDDSANRQRLERQVQETIYLNGMTTEELNEFATVVRNIFEVKQVAVQTAEQSILVRAPEDIIAPLNRTVADLAEGPGEVMLDVKLYEVDTTRTRNIGATIPTQAGIYNVDAAATSLVNSNQSLVQEAIAQGYISATASNVEVALALVASGLVQSSLLSSTVGFFGHGLTETGVTASTNTSFNLALNATDTRALDDVQMRLEDRQAGTFREGTKYPVTTSTYTSGISTPASSLSNATINGVSVASLLSQYAGGSSVTIPQVSYEDLGVTLNATPIVQRTGAINLKLELKIEALAGGSANGIPILASRQFVSDITVREGETALMVSNLNRTESAAVTGIPGLSELPGFQAPIDSDGERDTGQLIVLITPHLVHERPDLFAGPRIPIQNPRQAAGQ